MTELRDEYLLSQSLYPLVVLITLSAPPPFHHWSTASTLSLWHAPNLLLSPLFLFPFRLGMLAAWRSRFSLKYLKLCFHWSKCVSKKKRILLNYWIFLSVVCTHNYSDLWETVCMCVCMFVVITAEQTGTRSQALIPNKGIAGQTFAVGCHSAARLNSEQPPLGFTPIAPRWPAWVCVGGYVCDIVGWKNDSYEVAVTQPWVAAAVLQVFLFSKLKGHVLDLD